MDPHQSVGVCLDLLRHGGKVRAGRRPAFHGDYREDLTLTAAVGADREDRSPRLFDN
jgi:hypothetical protein